MSLTTIFLLATLFLEPLNLPPKARLWLFFPLVLCIAVVYRASRARTAAELPWPVLRIFFNTSAAMVALAAGFFILHQIVIRWG